MVTVPIYHGKGWTMSDEEHGQDKESFGVGHSGGGGHGGGGGGHGGGAHGGGHEEGGEGGCPEWMISFADNTALIMGFFVILLALMMAVPKGTGGADADGQDVATAEQLDWALDIRAGFNNPVSIDSINPRDRLLVQRLRDRARGEGKKDGSIDAPQSDQKDGQKVLTLAPTDYRALTSAVLFEKDSTALSAESTQTLLAFAAKVRGLRLVIEVRGYASPAETHERGDRGAAISFDRALAAANVLAENGIYWEQLRLVAGGRSSSARLPGYFESSQIQKQRVELFVTDEQMDTSP